MFENFDNSQTASNSLKHNLFPSYLPLFHLQGINGRVHFFTKTNREEWKKIKLQYQN